MKKIFMIIMILALGAFSGSFCQSSFAQEEDMLSYSLGTVSSISADSIVLNEYDEGTGEEAVITYKIDPAIIVNAVDSINDIKIGDKVEIAYAVMAEEKVAKIISVQNLLEAEPVSEEYMAE